MPPCVRGAIEWPQTAGRVRRQWAAIAIRGRHGAETVEYRAKSYARACRTAARARNHACGRFGHGGSAVAFQRAPQGAVVFA
jgi:hypothetical protein